MRTPCCSTCEGSRTALTGREDSTAGSALIGLDIGTSGVKAVVFDVLGNVCGHGFREYGIVCEEPGKAEQDPRLVWSLTLEALRDAVGASGIREAAAIGLSVQGDAIIPLDAHGEPVYQAVLGMDYRSAPEAEWCDRTLGARNLFDLTGMRPHALNFMVKALWLQRHRPGAWKAARRIVTYADYIISRLGAEPAIDWTMASRTMGFDLVRRQWSEEVLTTLGIDPALLSPAVPSGTVVGALSRDVAERIGLPPGVPLATGGHDQTCAAVGAGIVTPGLGLLSAGTADVLSTASRQPLLSDGMFEGYYPCYLHACPGLYFTFALNHIGGILFRWYRDTLGGVEVGQAQAGGRDPYDLMISTMPASPSPVMILPHFNGSGNPVCDMHSKGAIVGLTLSTTRGDLVKAILESLTFELRINLDYLHGAGVDVRELRAVAGGAKSQAWLQIRADILGRRVATLRVREAACLGAAVLAGTAAGVYSSVLEGVEQAVQVADAYQPNSARVAAYNERYETYREIYPALKGLGARF